MAVNNYGGKYQYAGINPLNVIDLTGEYFSLAGVVSVTAIISDVVAAMRPEFGGLPFGIKLSYEGDYSKADAMAKSAFAIFKMGIWDILGFVPILGSILAIKDLVELLILGADFIKYLWNEMPALLGFVVLAVCVLILIMIIFPKILKLAKIIFNKLSSHSDNVGNSVVAKVASASGGEVLPMTVVRTIPSKLKKGELAGIINEVKAATFVDGVEHALVKLPDGTRAIVKGGLVVFLISPPGRRFLVILILIINLESQILILMH